MKESDLGKQEDMNRERQGKKKGKDQQEESRKMLPMPVPMMGMEITDDLPGLCISYPILFRPYPNAEC